MGKEVEKSVAFRPCAASRSFTFSFSFLSNPLLLKIVIRDYDKARFTGFMVVYIVHIALHMYNLPEHID